MNAQVQTATKLSNLQMELLKLYSRNISDEQLKDIRKMLAEYFAARVDSEMDKLWQEKGWTKETIEGWKNDHLRVKSTKPEIAEA